MNPLDAIHATGIVPVVALPDPGHAVPLAQALVDGELPVAEVTFRTPAAAEGIGLMTRHFPDMLVGAGTVLTTDQVDAAVDAGAAFIVAPGFDPVVVDYCLERSIPVMPGVATASELTQAVLRELPAVKFFPAEAMGGLKTLKSLAAPFRPMRFMVTGGLSMDNMAPYLAWDRILAVGGSWMVTRRLVVDGHFARIRTLAAEAVQAVRKARA
ncbi:MAG: bifunctional 4-hydroxy-2-oxoglutarate aldolase/2-dehydro-3-deoxy-phosphogluconate aldolase [Desulfovibrionaceae bacterium]|nr:bifunctional 4-hydroxy-2-oxoglutarate aldolase/2-dehydro-3-deoxy-phosphogluconate aldolase [Desulfovibrionaceae bacterium]